MRILNVSVTTLPRPPLMVTALLISATLLRGQAQISDSAMAQIVALEQEKESRSPVERKLDAQFVFQLKQNRNQAIAAGVTHLKPDLRFETDGRVLVDIDAAVTTNLLAQIQQSGGTIIGGFPRLHSVRALVSVNELETLAGLAEVKFIRRASKAVTNAGSVDTEGDTTHRAAFARNNYGINGQGVKVGVLSDSVDYLTSAQSTGDLGEVTVLPGQAGSGAGEGTAMLEIVHDLAPGAQLYFATALYGEASFAQNILNLRSNGCDVIIDDVYYFDEPPFQDGIIAQAVNAVTADGALYFSAAGNDGNLNDGTSSTWEGDFVDSGQPVPPPLGSSGYGGRVHSFGATNYDTVISGGQGVDLFWADPLGASTNDYDLFLLDATGSYIEAVSDNPQTGTQDPYERIDSTPSTGYRIVIVKTSGAARFMHLVTARGKLSVSTAGATRGHSAAASAFSVAAVDAHDSFPGPFAGGAADPVEQFSSDGPRRVFFDASGSAITPGNFSSTGGAVRLKPDIAAADGVTTTLPGEFQPFFYGTSAAAPHAGAIAALLLSYNHSLTPGQIRAALTNSALDIGPPGFDSNSGAGIVMAEQALETLPPTPVIVAGNAGLVNESCPNGVIDPGETVTVSLSLANFGVAATSNLVATLLETGGVTFASAPRSYGALPAHGGNAIQLFTFVATGACGGTNMVTLQLQDGAMNLGRVSFAFQLGLQRIPLAELFDSVTPPALPSGWSTSSSGAGLPWQTTNGWSDTGSNSVFIADPGTTCDQSFISPLFHIYTASAQLSFVQNQAMAYGYSGGVLELSVNGGPFSNILTVGGSFVTNGYNGNLYSGYSNVLGDGAAVWTGYNGGMTTVANLPASAAGQDVRFRWRFVTGSYSYGNPYGWYVDSVQVADGYGCCTPTANTVVMAFTGAPNPVVLNGLLTYTINVANTGPGSATNVSVTDVLPPGFSVQSESFSQGVYPGPGLNGGGSINFDIGTLAGGNTATIVITGTAGAVGSMTNRVGISRADGGLVANSNSTLVTSVILPSLSINNASVTEDGTNATFNVSLWPAPATTASVGFATSNLTALAATNYFATNGTLTFASGVTNQTITVRVRDDLLDDPDTTFAVNLSNPVNAVTSQPQGIGTIFNVDPPPYLSVSDATVVAPNSSATNAVFNFNLSRPSGYTVSLYYATSDGSAIGTVYSTNGYYTNLDYLPKNGYLAFSPGQTNLSVSVFVTGHITVRPGQNFFMNANSVSFAKVLRGTGTGTILTALPGQLDHFSWDAIPSPQSNGIPLTATIHARDFFDGAAATFSGAAALSSFSVNSFRTNTFLGNLSYNEYSYGGPLTWGYSFTVKTNMAVTSLRSYQSDKVSLWKEDGTLLASQNVTNIGGWLETPLPTPIQLQAGHSYRLGVYTASYTAFNLISQARFDNPDALMGQDYAEQGDTFPDVPEPGIAAAVDVRYTVGIATSLPVTPTNSVTFTNSLWSGLAVVQLPATNVSLAAADGAGHVGFSSPFNVAPAPGYLTHFAWDPIPTNEPVGDAFGVAITALDYFNNRASNFTGPVAITASVPLVGTETNTMFGNATAPDSYYDIGVTYGQSFTPQTNITVTALRRYSGSKVSIWTTNGTLLASTSFTSAPGAWNETALATPLQLSAGQTYVIGAYLPSDADYLVYYGLNMSTNFADGAIGPSFYYYGDGVPVPNYGDAAHWYFVDFRYTASFLTNAPVAVSPPNSGAFTNGVWPGSLLVTQFATNLTLRASDGVGHLGLSNPFEVGFVPGLLDHFVWNAIPSPQTNAAPFAVTITGMDRLNHVTSNFNGTVTLASQQIPSSSILNGAIPQNAGTGGTYTLGYAFTPDTNVFATSFRHYFGVKISLWTDSGTLLASQNITDTPGAWVLTALTNPIPLIAGNTYRLGVLTPNTNFWFGSLATNYANGSVKAGYYLPGDGMPIYALARLWPVDVGYDFELPVTTGVTPAVSGNFVQGVWTGAVTVWPAATNVELLVEGSSNSFGLSNPFNVQDPPLLPPLLQSVYLEAGSFQFGWGAVPGHWYQIQYKTNLNQPGWLNLGGPVNATNVNLLLSQPVGTDPQRFYRVWLQP